MLNERLEAQRNSLNQLGINLDSETQPLIDYRFDSYLLSVDNLDLVTLNILESLA
jgi:hypothetical protein